VIEVQTIREAVRKRKARSENYRDIEFLRFSDDFQDIPRGTVILKEDIIWGYPHIGRIFMLEKGLREQFEHPFWVEEKIDGYNVRVFLYGDELLALSRGGYICPFTTDRLQDLVNPAFFEQNPDLILCMEVAGPENPYMEESPPFIKEDIQAFVFDIAQKNSRKFIPYREKVELVERYDLRAVPSFGRFTHEDTRKLKEIMLRLNEEGREGIVIKEDSERDRRAKYITSYANLNDIRITAKNMLQLPAEYYTNRILRLVLFLEEEGIGKNSHLYQELGRAFIDGLFEAIEEFKKSHKVSVSYRCKFRKKENALMLIEQLGRHSKHIQVIQKRLEKEGGFYILEFEKVFMNMTGLLGHLLGGGLVFD
jgi:putative ATP-dependent DNA ligase